jgi:nucleoside-diphosphate-sugar epimerase
MNPDNTDADRHKTETAHPLSGMRIAVTGATGMLGGELVRQLLPTGARIRLIVRNRTKLDPQFQNEDTAACELVNPIELRQALTGIDIVFHCAARVSFRLDDDEQLVRDNTDIAHHVVNACLDAGIGRLVHVSSIAALGEPDANGMITAASFPESLAGWCGYSLSKFYSENEVWRGIRSGLQAVIVNPSVILGPGDRQGEGSAALFATLSGGCPFYVPGENGYVDLRDVARAMILLSTAPGVVGRRFILNGANLSYLEFMTRAAESRGKKPPRWRVDERGLRLLKTLSSGIARLTGKKPLLTPGLVRAALAVHRYDGEAVCRIIDFEYRPVEETMRYLAAHLDS